MLLSVNENNFQQEVLEVPGPVLIDFWAPWCGICYWVHPILNQLQIQKYPQIKMVSINADNNLRLANTYRLATLPTLLILDQGQVCHRIEGFYDRDNLDALLQHIMETSLMPSMV
jgi:thioredoxin 1